MLIHDPYAPVGSNVNNQVEELIKDVSDSCTNNEMNQKKRICARLKLSFHWLQGRIHHTILSWKPHARIKEDVGSRDKVAY